MTPDSTFVLDASVFIEANRRYYAFDLAPGFWKSLIHHAEDGRILSIDKVDAELKRGKDELADWAKNHFCDWFASTDDNNVIKRFGEIMKWVHSQDQFFDAAKAEFAGKADGWLVAYAKCKGCVVVTEEVRNDDVRKKVPIPNICSEYNVPVVNTFKMLRELGVRLS